MISSIKSNGRRALHSLGILYRQANQPISVNSRLWRCLLVTIVAAFTLITLAQSLAIAPFEGPDEERHYAYARYLVNYRAIPPRIKAPIAADYITYKVGQEAGQSPLYYIPVALMTALVPDADAAAPYVVFNPLWSLSDDAGLPYDNHNLYLHGQESQFPFQGVALAVHLGRLVSIIAGVMTLFAVYGIGRALTPARPAVAVLATGLIASIPGFQFLHSVITNDVAVTLFATLSVWIAVRILREGPSPHLALMGGLFGALTLLAKTNGIWAIGIVCLALISSAFIYRKVRPIKSTLLLLGLSLGIFVLGAGWWFLYGFIQDGDPLGISIHVTNQGQSLLSFLKPSLSFFDSASLSLWERRMWYSVGWTLVYGPEWLYQTFRYVYLAGLLAAVAQCLEYVLRRKTQAHEWRQQFIDTMQSICLILAILFSIALAVLWQMTGRNLLGRYLYPGLTSAAVLSAIGWVWLLAIPSRLRFPRLITWAAAAILAVVLFRAGLWGAINSINSLSPHPMIEPVPADVTRTELTFLDPVDHTTPVAEVIGYRLHYQDLRLGNALYVDVCWKSLGYLKQSFPFSLQLVGPNDVRPGTRNSFHGLGSFPMSAWKPGEEFCDPTSIAITVPVDRPRAYNLLVTLFPLYPPAYKAGPPLTAVDAAGREIYPVIGRMRVAPSTQGESPVTPTVNLGDVAGVVSSQVQLQSNNVISFTIRFVALNQTQQNDKVFVHLEDPLTGKIIAQDDHEPDMGWFPTNYWLKGDIIDDQFTIKIPPGTNLDQLKLRLGMYDAQTQVRLQATDIATGARLRDDEVQVTP